MGWLTLTREGLDIVGPISTTRHAQLFPPELKSLIIVLQRHFAARRWDLLDARKARQAQFDRGETPTYLKNHPAHEAGWKVAPIPKDLQDRRVEITGPVNSTKMVINMLSANSTGEIANMAMLDFEDSMCPTWENILDGYENVMGVARGDLTFTQTEGGKSKTYKLDPKKMAHPMVRVRGLHLDEENLIVDGEAVAGGLCDLAVVAYHTANLFLTQGKTPKFYVPKCESHLEARWWNDLFALVEKKMGLPHGCLRMTFLIETLPAAFEMEEILYEARERVCALNVGRWDKIFSDIKVLKNHTDRIMADRGTIDMLRPWMENYAKRLVKICHKRGAFAMGGMAAFTPGKDEATRTQQANKVKADKTREAQWGHDGCWVSHPYFIGLAQGQFPIPNQNGKTLDEFPMQPELLPKGGGPYTLAGLQTNLRVAIAYTEGWLRGLGCISFENLMEDLATLEISRAQVWQWQRHAVALDNGERVTPALISKILDDECAKFLSSSSEEAQDLEEYKETCTRYLTAKGLVRDLVTTKEFPEFFTIFMTRNQGRMNAQRERTYTKMEERRPLEGH